MNTANAPLVIIGAGHAGGRAALTLRSEGYGGRLILIGDEAHAPYERPPLSKGLLQGTTDLAGCSLCDSTRLDELVAQRNSLAKMVNAAASMCTIRSR